ncbi:MAG: vitamin K epoxide reductase family protein, partial [Planctomycetota bacterium]
MPRPAKKKTKKKTPPAAVPVPRAWSSARRYGGAALAAVAAVAALLLVIQHFAGAWLPGCGPGSACQQLAKSAWGRVPGIGWPVSHVGLAYFAALAVAWALLTDGVPAWLRWIVRLGALGSVVLVGVMAAEGHWCLYCLAVHVANLALWWLTERSPASPPAAAAARSAPVAAAGVFAAATAALVVVQLVQGEAIAEQAERDRSDSTRRIIAGGGDGDRAGGPFTGRYRLGPEVAPIRLVVFSDYQCVDCNRVEGELRA